MLLENRKGIRYIVLLFACILVPVILMVQPWNDLNNVTWTQTVVLATWEKYPGNNNLPHQSIHKLYSHHESNAIQIGDKSSALSQPELAMNGSKLSHLFKYKSMKLKSETHVYEKHTRPPNSSNATSWSSGISMIQTQPNQSALKCSLLFKGDKEEIEKAKHLNKSEEYHIPPDEDIIESTKDCHNFIQSRGYITNVSSEEADFPLAFAIRMHFMSAQVERLLRSIYRPHNVYCIYVDQKSPTSVHKAMRSLAHCFNNVFIVSKIDNYVYTSFSPVEADLQCMKETLNTNIKWKYFLNLAGTEFPLKTNLEIVTILKLLNGKNDIEQYTYPEFFLNRIRWKYVVKGNKLINTSISKEPFTSGNITVLKGCSYNSFSRAFVQWVLEDNLPQLFINWTKDLHSPDEVVWASLNSHIDAPGGYSGMITQISKTFLSRAIIWYSSYAYCAGHYYVRGICILSVGDLSWLGGRWELFANKFDLGYDHLVLDCLEEAIYNRTMNPDLDHDIKWFGIYRAPHVQQTPKPGLAS